MSKGFYLTKRHFAEPTDVQTLIENAVAPTMRMQKGTQEIAFLYGDQFGPWIIVVRVSRGDDLTCAHSVKIHAWWPGRSLNLVEVFTEKVCTYLGLPTDQGDYNE